jgi:hypothetical protein
MEDKLEKEREGKWNTKEETSGERSEERNAVIGDRCDLSAEGKAITAPRDWALVSAPVNG